MPCPDQQAIELFVLHRLGGQESRALQDHLALCPDCRESVRRAQADREFLARLRQAQTDEPPPPKVACAQPVLSLDQAQVLLGPRYRVIRRIGSGEIGAVFQAIDPVLDRQVAVKFLGQDQGLHEWHEARLMGRLNHPNIAHVYEIGRADPYRYMVMEWVDGSVLTEAWRDLDLPQRLRLYLEVCDAVAAAHRRDIIHRDLKPANILVTSTLAAKVLDFGIATEIADAQGLDPTVFRGTPAYSAPEQITVPVRVSKATDVYALGVLLYELLTRSLPFTDTDPAALFAAIRERYPELPTALEAQVPLALQNICLKCLEKDPSHRYPDAQSLAQDIRRVLAGEKVWARPSFVMDQVRQEVFLHRQRLMVWAKNDLLTQRECDRLESIYTLVIDPDEPSILESRRLSYSQICLYLGGWIAVLGSIVLFYRTWATIPVFWRTAPAWLAAALMMATGLILWQRREVRLALGFLATANLLVPVTLALTLGQWDLLSAGRYPWGDESVHRALAQAGSHVLVGNAQLYVSAWFWVAVSAGMVCLTRSSIFTAALVLAFLALATVGFLIDGMARQTLDGAAGRYLVQGAGLFTLGSILDHKQVRRFAWPPWVAGLGLMVISLTLIACSDNTLFGWLHSQPAALNSDEHHGLSFLANGLLYLTLAWVCRRVGTPLQRSGAQVLNWLGSVHTLAPLRILDLDGLSVPAGHRLVYRWILPLASLGFVFASVTRQMKSFFFSGLGGLAAAIHKISVEHLDRYFGWPVALIGTGLFSMFASWILPRLQARRSLRRRG